MKIFENENKKYIVCNNYNCILDKKSNSFIRCGNTINEIPISGSIEYIDVELSNIYTNIKKYPFLFKTKPLNNEKYLNFNIFKKIINVLPKSLNHINFISDPECKTNPNLWDILEYCKLKNITTSITVDNIDKETARRLSTLCKIISVNTHQDKNICYNTIKNISDFNIKPILNILVSKETHHIIIRIINDYHKDSRLSNLSNLYLIGLKKIENWRFLNDIDKKRLNDIIKNMLENNIPFNTDCQLTPYVISKYKNKLNQYHNMQFIQCEAFTFSAYIDVYNYIFPCRYYIPTNHFWGFNILDFDKYWNNENFIKIKKLFMYSKNNKKYCFLY